MTEGPGGARSASGAHGARGARVVVVGGGISGLAAAWFLRQTLGDDARITVLEQRDAIGGHLRVAEVAGLAVDEGAESVLARRPEALDLLRAVGLGDEVTYPAGAGAGIWSRGQMHPMPAGTVMGVPERPSSLAGLLTADEVARAADPDGPDGPDMTDRVDMPVHADVAIGQLVAARMGRAVVDRLLEPLLGGIYAGHADELSLDATVPALGAAARRYASLSEAVGMVRHQSVDQPGPALAGLVGGVGRLPEAIARVGDVDVRTGVAVRELRHRVNGGWELVTGPVPDPGVVETDAVVLAVPPASAARLLRGVSDAAASELAAIETASMAIVTLAMPAAAFPVRPSASGFLVPPADGRTIKAVTYSSVKWPWLGERARDDDVVVLRASIGRHRQVGELQRDDDELVEATLADLHAAVGASGRPVDTRVTRWGGALPQYAVGHLERVERVRQALSTVPRLAVCGAVYEGVGIAACVAAARIAADRVAEQLRAEHARIEA